VELAREISAVVAVFALLVVVLWMLRRGGFAALKNVTRGSRSLEPVERLALTQSHALHLVKIRGRELVVATHPNGCSLLIDRVDGESA